MFVLSDLNNDKYCVIVLLVRESKQVLTRNGISGRRYYYYMLLFMIRLKDAVFYGKENSPVTDVN